MVAGLKMIASRVDYPWFWKGQIEHPYIYSVAMDARAGDDHNQPRISNGRLAEGYDDNVSRLRLQQLYTYICHLLYN